jgi:lipid-binding SYLF domain-containing protein
LISALATALSFLFWAADAARGLDAAAQGGFIVGGEHGSGVVICRTYSGWSAPVFITGDSVGLQAGAEHQLSFCL